MSGSGKKEVAALLVSDPYEDESNSRTHKALDHTGDAAIKHNGYDSAAKIASKKVNIQGREGFLFRSFFKSPAKNDQMKNHYHGHGCAG